MRALQCLLLFEVAPLRRVAHALTCGFWDNVLVAKGYRPIDRDQVFLLPPNLRDWLPAGHRVWFVLDIVEQLDLSKLHEVSKRGGVGRAGYHPDVLMAVLIYAYMHGQLSSRGIERACTSDVAYMVACGRDVPDHTVIARFRQVHQAALKDLFAQVLAICKKAGMGKFGVVAIDGTKIAGNASMRANRKYSRLKEKAAEVLERSAAVDAAEDIRHGEKGIGLDLLPLWTDPQERPDLINEVLAEIRDTDDDPDNDDDQRPLEGTPDTPSTEVAMRPSAEVAMPASTEVAVLPSAEVAGVADAASTEVAVLPSAEVAGVADADAASTEVAVLPSAEVAMPASTEVAVLPSAEVAVTLGSVRAARFAADKDARVLAAFASISAQEAARDAAVREPKVVKALARVAHARDRLARVRAEVEASHLRTAERIAAGLQRRGAHVPVEEHGLVARAEKVLANMEQRLAVARASGRPAAQQIDPMGNLTDPDSRKMRCSGGGYLQGYNAQLAVSDDHLILATSISQSPNDQASGVPMINAAVAAVEKLAAATGLPGLAIGMLVLDAGYCSIETITAPGPDRLIATLQSKAPHQAPGQVPEATGRTRPSPAITTMTERLTEPANVALYKRRGATVEPVNAHIKDGRGLRRFSRRGLAAVESELSIAAWVTNLTRLYQYLNPEPGT
jgi:transposase